MKTLQALKKWILNACVYYTFISMFFILIRLTLGNLGDSVINYHAFLLFLPCSLGLSAAGMLSKSKALPRWFRILSHYVITLLCVILFIWLPIGKEFKGSTALILLVVFSVLYWILFAVIHLFKGRIRRLLEETKE